MTVASAVSLRPRVPVVASGHRVSGLWQRVNADGSLSFSVQKRVAGRVKRITLPRGITKTDAVKEARKLTVGIDAGEVAMGDRRLTLEELSSRFFASERGPLGRRSESTLTLYEGRMKKHVIPFLGVTTKVASITPGHVERLADHLALAGQSGSSIRGCLSALSAVLGFGCSTRGGKVLAKNVALLAVRDSDTLPSGKRQTEPRYLDAEQVEALLAATSETYRAVATACYWGALRISEALALRWSDVLGDDLLVRGTKTKASAAKIPLLPPLKAALDAHRKARMALGLHLVSDDALIFGTASGKPLNRRNVLRAIWAAGGAAGLNQEGEPKVGLHDLRHSAAARAFALGMTAPEVARWLRHANPAITLTFYAGISDTVLAGIGAKLAVGL